MSPQPYRSAKGADLAPGMVHKSTGGGLFQIADIREHGRADGTTSEDTRLMTVVNRFGISSVLIMFLDSTYQVRTDGLDFGPARVLFETRRRAGDSAAILARAPKLAGILSEMGLSYKGLSALETAQLIIGWDAQ